MANQNGDSGASVAFSEPEPHFAQQETGLGINVFDNPFAGASAQECVTTMQSILGDPEILLEIIDIRITQMQNTNPQGYRLCHQEGVLPYSG